ncbi:MAG: HNH endonuclease [Arcobacteraceae bacterium]|nr:HNH endonuclease [Arcobacteraceae bacterium]
MAFLGNDFIISSTILIVVIFSFLYIYRKKIFKAYYQEIDFDLFEKQIKEYLQTNHPKINFNYKIINSSQNELNPKTRCYTIIDNLVEQFINTDIDTNFTPRPISQNQLWDSYTFNAKPIGTKLPDDWAKRKMVVAVRDNNICQRCGIHTKPENIHLFLLKSIKDGGQFYLENLIIICKDCQKVTTKKDLKYLNIKDELNSFVQ